MYTRPLRSNELYHSGILGMKWGVRRYQNKDGSLTPAGKLRYLKSDGHYGLSKQGERRVRSLNKANRKLERRASKYDYRAENYARTADEMTSKYLISFLHPTAHFKASIIRNKSGKFHAQAARAREMMQNNQRMIDALERPVSEIYKENRKSA